MIISGIQQSNSATHIHISILPQTPLSSRLSYNIEQSVIYYTVGPYWLSILNTTVYTRRSQTPFLPLPFSLPTHDYQVCLFVF